MSAESIPPKIPTSSDAKKDIFKAIKDLDLIAVQEILKEDKSKVNSRDSIYQSTPIITVVALMGELYGSEQTNKLSESDSLKLELLRDIALEIIKYNPNQAAIDKTDSNIYHRLIYYAIKASKTKEELTVFLAIIKALTAKVDAETLEFLWKSKNKHGETVVGYSHITGKTEQEECNREAIKKAFPEMVLWQKPTPIIATSSLPTSVSTVQLDKKATPRAKFLALKRVVSDLIYEESKKSSIDLEKLNHIVSWITETTSSGNTSLLSDSNLNTILQLIQAIYKGESLHKHMDHHGMSLIKLPDNNFTLEEIEGLNSSSDVDKFITSPTSKFIEAKFRSEYQVLVNIIIEINESIPSGDSNLLDILKYLKNKTFTLKSESSIEEELITLKKELIILYSLVEKICCDQNKIELFRELTKDLKITPVSRLFLPTDTIDLEEPGDLRYLIDKYMGYINEQDMQKSTFSVGKSNFFKSSSTSSPSSSSSSSSQSDSFSSSTPTGISIHQSL